MAVIFRRTGGTIERTSSNARTAGHIEELDSGTNFVCVYTTDIAANEKGEPASQGVFEITKNDPTDVIAEGKPVVITVVTLDATVAAGAGGKHVAAKATANGDTTMLVQINVR